MTFSTDLLSHTQVLKLRKLFPARHILHNESTNSTLVKKGKRATPHPPKDAAGMFPALPPVEGSKNPPRSEADCGEDRKAARK